MRDQILRKSRRIKLENMSMRRDFHVTLTLKHRVDQLKGIVDFLANFGAGQDNFAAYENQEDNLRFDHAIYETREQLRFIRTEIVMATSKTFKTDGELDVARANNVLNLEVRELGIEAELLNDTSILARGKLRIILGFCAGHDHLARSKYERSSLWIANTHDNRSKTLLKFSINQVNYSSESILSVPLGYIQRFLHEERSS